MFCSIFEKSSWIRVCFLVLTVGLEAKIYFANKDSTLGINQANSSLELATSLTDLSGTLAVKDNVAATITSTDPANKLNFSNGMFVTGNVSSTMSGALDATSTDTIVLNNGDFLDVQSGVVSQAVSVASGATASIMGQPRFASAITLTDNTSVLQVAMTTELNQSVSGAGTLSLLDDLSLGYGVALPSLVAMNQKTLHCYGGSYSSAVTFSGGGSFFFDASTSLTETWTVGSGSEVYHFNGNGTILDLSSSGNIVFNGATMYVSDCVVRGLSDTNALKGTGRYVFSNVTLEMGGNFARTDGSFTFRGEACKVITNGATFQISGAGNEILVDGIILKYDQLDGSGADPFAAVSDGAINFVNNGSIQSGMGVSSDDLIIATTSYTFTRHFALTTSSTIRVANADPLTSKSVAINGGGHAISFPMTSGSFFMLDANVQVTFSNIVLRNYYPAAMSLGTDSTITFGDGVMLEMDADLTILSGDPAWTFNGNATIDGKGSMLTIEKSQGVTITGTKTLTMKNLIVKPTVADGFKAVDDTATVALQNVDLLLQSAGFNFSQGNLSVVSLVKLTGNAGATAGSVNFEFSSKGTMVVQANAELEIFKGVNFKYNADATNDTTMYDSKRHFSLAQIGSKLTLRGCSLQSTDTGLALDQGTVNVVDEVVFTATATDSSAFEVGANLDVKLSAGANFKMSGAMTYAEAAASDYLLYGQTIKLRHNTYGFDVHARSLEKYQGYLSNALGGTSLPSDLPEGQYAEEARVPRDEHYIMPGMTPLNNEGGEFLDNAGAAQFWGDPSLIGTSVKSGDFIAIQNKVAAVYENPWGSGCVNLFLRPSIVFEWYTMGDYSYPAGGLFAAIQGNMSYQGISGLMLMAFDIDYYTGMDANSNPPPDYIQESPYFRACWGKAMKVLFRIYKYGGTIGDPIKPSDPVYFVFFKNSLDDAADMVYQSFMANSNPWYMGSDNVTVDVTRYDQSYVYPGAAPQGYFTCRDYIQANTCKSVYWYIGDGTNKPNNFESTFLWKMVVTDATLPAYAPFPSVMTDTDSYFIYHNNGVFYPDMLTMYDWPTPANHQF